MTGILLGVLWLVAAVGAGIAAATLLRRTGATAFEVLAGGVAAGVVVPTLACTWVWLLPIDTAFGMAIGCGLTVAGAATVLWRRRRELATGLRRPRRALAAAAAPGVLLLAIASVSLWASSHKPIDGWDPLMYHGPVAASLVSGDGLFGWDTPSPFTAYPELVSVQAAQVHLVTGSSSLLDAVQIASLVALGLVAWAWAGRGRPRPLPGAVTSVTLLSPAIYPQLRELQVDVGYAAALLAGLWCVGLWFRYRSVPPEPRRSRPGDVLLPASGLFIGAAAAAKPSGLTAAAAFAGVVALLFVARRVRFRVAAASAATLLFGGLPFYLRNSIEHGNPFFPMAVDLGPLRLEGLVDAATFTASPPRFAAAPGPLKFLQNLVVSARTPPLNYNYDLHEGGFGRIVVLLALLLLAGAIVALVRRPPGLWRELVVPAVSVVLLASTQPQSWYPRYMIAGFMLLAVIAGMLWADLPPRVAAVSSVVLVVGGIALLVNDEQRMGHGLPALADYAASLGPLWDTGVNGATTAYGTTWAFLADAPCATAVAVVADPQQLGGMSTFNLGAWGDAFCNDVSTIERDPRRPHLLDQDDLEASMHTRPPDFAVVPQAAVRQVTDAVDARGGSAVEVAAWGWNPGSEPQVAMRLTWPG